VYDAPIVCPQQRVEPGWIDYNGHMNMAFYNLAFDRGLDHVYDLLDIGADYAGSGAGSCFTLEVHVSYLRELVLDDPLRVEFRLLEWDAKRLHFFEEMYHAEGGYLAATSEQLALHVDMGSRRAAPFPDAVQERLRRMMASHGPLPRPPQVGRVIGIPRRPAETDPAGAGSAEAGP
jgi:acyl-CoA thioester hydrolase